MRKLILILLFIPVISFSQGFNWQYDPRMPFDYPDLFVNIDINYGRSFHNSDFSFLEKRVVCTDITGGSGNEFSLGFGAEYWHSQKITFTGSLNYMYLSGTFTSPEVYPRKEYDLETEYIFDAGLHYAELEAGVKHRLLGTKFFAGGTLGFNIFLSEDNSFREEKIAPVHDPFRDRNIEDASIGNLTTVVLIPSLYLGYDLNLGKSKYGSVYLKASTAINSMISSESWRATGVSVGVKVNRAVF